MPAVEPETAERSGEPQPEHAFAGLSRPVQRRPDVAVLALELVRPPGLVGIAQARRNALGEPQAPPRLGLAGLVRVAPRPRQLLERVLADGLEHGPPRFAVRLLGEPQKSVVDQRREMLKRRRSD